MCVKVTHGAIELTQGLYNAANCRFSRTATFAISLPNVVGLLFDHTGSA